MNTIQLHRVIRTTPQKIFRAFLDGDAMAKWLPPHGRRAGIDTAGSLLPGLAGIAHTVGATGRA